MLMLLLMLNRWADEYIRTWADLYAETDAYSFFDANAFSGAVADTDADVDTDAEHMSWCCFWYVNSSSHTEVTHVPWTVIFSIAVL